MIELVLLLSGFIVFYFIRFTPKFDPSLKKAVLDKEKVHKALQRKHKTTLKSLNLPPGQKVSKKWIVLDLGIRPAFNRNTWKLRLKDQMTGRTERLSLQDIIAMGTQTFNTDFHCYTGWTVQNLNMKGVQLKKIIDWFKPDANWSWIYQIGADGYTTNAPRDVFERDDIFLAFELDDEELPMEHGSIRIINTQLYGSKSCKFLKEIRFMDNEEKGFWEQRGIHHRGKVWSEERFDKLVREKTGIEAAREIINKCEGTYLDLSGMELEEIPVEIYQFKDLYSLILNNNKLKEIPSELCSNLRNLHLLSINANQLVKLPDNIDLLWDLNELWVCDNKLTSLPNCISNMNSINVIGVDTNQLTRLPDGMGKMKHLMAIFADYNQIKTLPVELAYKSNMRALMFSNNPLEEIPTEYHLLEDMQWFGLFGCKCIPEEIVIEGIESILSYLKEKHYQKK